MDLEVYYLHSCARTSANWLKDSDVLDAHVFALRLLATAVAYQTCEVDNVLPNPGDAREPHVQWAMKSRYNYHWVYSYYASVCELVPIVNQEAKHNNYFMQRRLLSYIDVFPDELFCPPPFLYPIEYVARTTEESYRAYYKAVRAKPGAYRRIPPPFWAKGVRRGPVIIQPESTEAFNLDEDPFADLR